MNPDVRIDSHFKSSGSVWTKKYKPIKLLKLIENCDDYDEDKYTIKYMKKYGVNNVRGGSFCQFKLTDEAKNVIGQMIDGSEDRCFRCHRKGHFKTDCHAKIPSGIEEGICCKYCERKFKTQRGATFHENFYCIKNYKKYRKCEDCGESHRNRIYDYCNKCKINIFKGSSKYKGKNFHWIMINDQSWCSKVYREIYFKNSRDGDSLRNYLRDKNFGDINTRLTKSSQKSTIPQKLIPINRTILTPQIKSATTKSTRQRPLPSMFQALWQTNRMKKAVEFINDAGKTINRYIIDIGSMIDPKNNLPVEVEDNTTSTTQTDSEFFIGPGMGKYSEFQIQPGEEIPK